MVGIRLTERNSGYCHGNECLRCRVKRMEAERGRKRCLLLSHGLYLPATTTAALACNEAKKKTVRKGREGGSCWRTTRLHTKTRQPKQLLPPAQHTVARTASPSMQKAGLRVQTHASNMYFSSAKAACPTALRETTAGEGPLEALPALLFMYRTPPTPHPNSGQRHGPLTRPISFWQIFFREPPAIVK